MKKYLFLVGFAIFSSSSYAATISWVDWEYNTDSPGFSGVVDGVDVSFAGNYYDFHYPVSGGSSNFWIHPASVQAGTYTAPPAVDNAPSDSDVIVMRETGMRTITFSQAVVNPVMALVSVGRSTIPVQYQFDTDFTILNVGPGTFDPSGNGSLTQLSSNILEGIEGHGLIQFIGTYSSISWNVDVYEDFHAIQIGVESAVVPVPATVWLFGSGLIGLVGIAGRKKA